MRILKAVAPLYLHLKGRHFYWLKSATSRRTQDSTKIKFDKEFLRERYADMQIRTLVKLSFLSEFEMLNERLRLFCIVIPNLCIPNGLELSTKLTQLFVFREQTSIAP
jgi:hypothetical protein